MPRALAIWRARILQRREGARKNRKTEIIDMSDVFYAMKNKRDRKEPTLRKGAIMKIAARAFGPTEDNSTVQRADPHPSTFLLGIFFCCRQFNFLNIASVSRPRARKRVANTSLMIDKQARGKTTSRPSMSRRFKVIINCADVYC